MVAAPSVIQARCRALEDNASIVIALAGGPGSHRVRPRMKMMMD